MTSYMLISEDCMVTTTKKEPELTWDCYPVVVRLSFIGRNRIKCQEYTEKGWIDIKEIEA